MNPVELLLNFVDFSKFCGLLATFLILLITYILLSSDSSIISDDSDKVSNELPVQNKKEEETEENESKKNELIEIKGFHRNEMAENGDKFILCKEKEKICHLSQKIIDFQKNIMSKNEELAMMYMECLGSLNSWKRSSLERELFKEINWNVEKRESEEESLVSQYVYPQLNLKDAVSCISMPNLSSSQSSINSNAETEDGEEEKEKILLNNYKLGICRIFDNFDENGIKTNIVKEVKGNFYKVYSAGDSNLIKEICRKETIPENLDEIVGKYQNDGCGVICFSGKKMKMNYLQCQKVERSKCESNMIFLGFAVYKDIYNGYKSAYS